MSFGLWKQELCFFFWGLIHVFFCISSELCCRAVRAMNETLKQHRLLRDNDDGSPSSYSANDQNNLIDPAKNVCLPFLVMMVNSCCIFSHFQSSTRYS